MPDTGPVGTKWRCTIRRTWNGSRNTWAAAARPGPPKPSCATAYLTAKPVSAMKTQRLPSPMQALNRSNRNNHEKPAEEFLDLLCCHAVVGYFNNRVRLESPESE